MLRTVPLSIIRRFSLYKQQWHMSYRFCWQFASRIRTELSCCVYSEKNPDDGQRNCPKLVEFYSKNKFQKLVHLVGFIIKIFKTTSLFVTNVINYLTYVGRGKNFRFWIILLTSKNFVKHFDVCCTNLSRWHKNWD